MVVFSALNRGVMTSAFIAVYSQGETNMPLASIHILARTSQPTRSSIIQRLFLLSFPGLCSSTSPYTYTPRFCHLCSQAYHNRALMCLFRDTPAPQTIAGTSSKGSHTWNALPPSGQLSAQIRPRCNDTRCLQMVSPNPRPYTSRVRRVSTR
jgi:hypothetical protein